MTRRAYGTMPLGVEDELAQDSFIRALSPTELSRHVQMAEPPSLRVAVEVARKRELIWGTVENGSADRQPEVRAVLTAGPESVKPGWVDELSGLVRAASLAIKKNSRQSRNTTSTTITCWGCDQPGHRQRGTVTDITIAGETTTGPRAGGMHGPTSTPRHHSERCMCIQQRGAGGGDQRHPGAVATSSPGPAVVLLSAKGSF
ncbi:hypothetical protein UPYG_G00182440 [Umbra pygmaea]|uniref:Uncharacterized protein n=1 Tax=Umbra pygmaea TaxID=75934 RepID=A0ABD0WRN2_UMBPY